jgi:hypothetical protein
MDGTAQAQDRIDTVIPALYGQTDPYSVLVNAIASASSDPARLRKLVYAMAVQHLKPAAAREPIPDPVQRATTLLELEEALQFEYAIERIERDAVALGENGEERSQPPEMGGLGREDTSHQNHLLPALAEHAIEPTDDRLPKFLDPLVRAARDIAEYAPLLRRSGLSSFAPIAIAFVAGVVFYAGVADWARWERQSIAAPAPTGTASAPLASTMTSYRPETVGSGQAQVRQRWPDPAPAPPFPLPRTYGVYAESNGRLATLQPLPIRLPTGQFQLSGEITEPSRALVSGDGLKFVVYKRGLAADVQETMSVRVVARVARAMTFVNGIPTMTPVAGVWRVRDKSYQLRTSPVEGNPDMLRIEPEDGLVFPAGRYALMLNGEGYDFTVPGPITVMEQCLEQFQAQNGMILSECPKS